MDNNNDFLSIPDWYQDEVDIVNLEEPKSARDIDFTDIEDNEFLKKARNRKPVIEEETISVKEKITPDKNTIKEPELDIDEINLEELNIEDIELVTPDLDSIETGIKERLEEEENKRKDKEVSKIEKRAPDKIGSIDVAKLSEAIEKQRSSFLGQSTDDMEPDVDLVNAIAQKLSVGNTVAEDIIIGLQKEVTENANKLGIDTTLLGKQKATKLTLDLFEKLNESKTLSKTYATQLIKAEERLLNPDNEGDLFNLIMLVCGIGGEIVEEEDYQLGDKTINLEEEVYIEEELEDIFDQPEEEEIGEEVVEEEIVNIEIEEEVTIEEDIVLENLSGLEFETNISLEEDINIIGLAELYDDPISENKIPKEELAFLHEVDEDESSTYSLKDIELKKDKIKDSTVF